MFTPGGKWLPMSSGQLHYMPSSFVVLHDGWMKDDLRQTKWRSNMAGAIAMLQGKG